MKPLICIIQTPAAWLKACFILAHGKDGNQAVAHMSAIITVRIAALISATVGSECISRSYVGAHSCQLTMCRLLDGA